ncbi:MAG: PEP-CTERM sorting domain-containing protein [Nitrospirota bacterium]
MKKFLFVMTGIIFALVLTQSAHALTWVTSPDGNVSGDPETTYLTLGVSDQNKLEGATQTPGIFGMSAHLINGFTSHTVSLSAKLRSWDSYNALNGYDDVFLMALTEGDYYWNLPITHPVDLDSQLIWPLTASSWGGTAWGDGIRDDILGTNSWIFNVDSSKDYYLNLILDTSNSDNMYPSWGYMGNLSIQSTPFEQPSVPEPATLLLIGSGLAGIGIWRRKAGVK